MDLTLSPPRQPVVDEALELTRRVRRWPSARVVMNGSCAAIHSGVLDARIARIELGTGLLTVFVLADLARPLVAAELLVRPTRDGLCLEVRDATAQATGERVLHWRIDLERFGSQLRYASP
jgi:hypothetical protein